MPPEPDAALASGLAGKRIYEHAVFGLGGGAAVIDIGLC